MIYGFGAGALDPVSTPSHLIVVVALGLLLGQQGKAHWKAALPSFIVSLIAGLVLSNFYNNPFPLDNTLILLFIALVAGLLAVLAYPIPRWLTWILAVKAGMVLGLDTIPPALPGISPHKIYLTLAGAACSSSILLLGIALLSLYLCKLWEGIALRVLGSWVTASAMLTLALRFTHKI
jgi:urease accessory protein